MSIPIESLLPFVPDLSRSQLLKRPISKPKPQKKSYPACETFKKPVSAPEINVPTPKPPQLLDFDNIHIIGDSIIRKQGQILSAMILGKAQALCYPGCGISKVSDAIKESESTPADTYIISVGTNDINSLPTNEIKDRYVELLLNLKDKRAKNTVLVAILPRLLADKNWSDTALEFNLWLKEQSINFKCQLIDMSEIFKDDFSLYRRDGIHLNDKGKDLFSKIILQKLAQRNLEISNFLE